MKVILTERVSTLGNIGEVVNVSAGFARNFLIPRKQAVVADEKNSHILTEQKKRLNKKIATELAAAEAVKAKLEGLSIELEKRVGASGKLFGTVTNSDLAKILEAKGITVDRRQLVIENPIKALGTFEIKAKLFTGVEAHFKVKLSIDPVQAEELKKQQADAAKKKKEAKEKAAAEAATAAAATTETTEA